MLYLLNMKYNIAELNSPIKCAFLNSIVSELFYSDIKMKQINIVFKTLLIGAKKCEGIHLR